MVNSPETLEAVRMLMDLTSRIDERVKNLTEMVEKNEQRFMEVMAGQQQLMHRVIALEQRDHNSLKDDVSNLYARIGAIETGLMRVELVTGKQNSRWDKVVDYSKDFLVAVAAAFVIWKFGLGT